jgi:hypothetical protein
MKNILEQAIVHLLNEENDKANELFHRYMVERARQIHESLRQGEPDACSEEYFGESDLDGIESDADSDMVPTGEDNAEFGASEADAEGDEDAAGDLDDDVDGDDTYGDDAVAGDDLGNEEETLDDIKASIDELIAKFDEMMGTGDDDADADAEGDDDNFGDDTDAGDDYSDEDSSEDEDHEDDFTGADDQSDDVNESEDDEDGEDADDDFDAITESIIAELEKVSVAHADDKEIGTGKTVGGNKTSALPSKKADPADAKPVKIDSKDHVGFEREPAPASKSLKKAKNTRSKSTDGMEKVSKEGDKSSALNKDFAGSAGNDKSPLAKKGSPF